MRDDVLTEYPKVLTAVYALADAIAEATGNAGNQVQDHATRYLGERTPRTALDLIVTYSDHCGGD